MGFKLLKGMENHNRKLLLQALRETMSKNQKELQKSSEVKIAIESDSSIGKKRQKGLIREIEHEKKGTSL